MIKRQLKKLKDDIRDQNRQQIRIFMSWKDGRGGGVTDAIYVIIVT